MCSEVEVTQAPSPRMLADAALTPAIDRSFRARDRAYGARRLWRDVPAEGLACDLRRVDRLMRPNASRAPPRRRVPPAINR
jgi:putative transposase